MIKTLWSAWKRASRITWKCFKWLFLLTLPLTAAAIVCGISNGFYFAFWQSSLIDKHTDAFLHEMKELDNDWGVPGMTFRDYQDTKNDFLVMRLNFNDWVTKMGFVHPKEYGEYALELDTPINRYGDFDAFMVDTRPSCGSPPPKEQWVYISEWAWPTLNEWDTAFETAIQAGYVPSALNQSRLFFTKCRENFLCGVWGVRAPTLLHFLVEDSAPEPEDVDPGLTYSASLSNLRPVTVRVIEFPLIDTYTGLPSSVFPSPKEQMLAIMRGDKLYEQFEPWTEFEQILRRFHEYVDDNYYDVKGTYLYYLGKVSSWVVKRVEKPLGIQDVSAIVYTISFLSTGAIVKFFILWPWHLVKDLVSGFFGYPKRGDRILGDGSEKEWNPLDQMMGMGGFAGGFNGLFDDLIQSAEVEKNFPGGKITTGEGSHSTLNTELAVTAEFKW
jgi:hypothetical protein